MICVIMYNAMSIALMMQYYEFGCMDPVHMPKKTCFSNRCLTSKEDEEEEEVEYVVEKILSHRVNEAGGVEYQTAWLGYDVQGWLGVAPRVVGPSHHQEDLQGPSRHCCPWRW